MRRGEPLDAFPPVRRGEPKLQSWCRERFAACGREYYRKNREFQNARLVAVSWDMVATEIAKCEAPVCQLPPSPDR
jgi:hypothetical protein